MNTLLWDFVCLWPVVKGSETLTNLESELVKKYGSYPDKEYSKITDNLFFYLDTPNFRIEIVNILENGNAALSYFFQKQGDPFVEYERDGYSVEIDVVCGIPYYNIYKDVQTIYEKYQKPNSSAERREIENLLRVPEGVVLCEENERELFLNFFKSLESSIPASWFNIF